VEVEQVKQSINMTPAEKLVFEKLVFYCLVIKGAKGFTTVSNRKMAEDLGITRLTSMNCIKKLVDKKMIRKEIIEPDNPRNQSKTNNRYQYITIVGGRKKIWIQKFIGKVIE
jgi:DNA-binding Lrp family transcriptional regulator